MTNSNGNDSNSDNDNYSINSTSSPQSQSAKGKRRSITVAIPSSSALSASNAATTAAVSSSSRTPNHSPGRDNPPPQPLSMLPRTLELPEDHPLGHPPRERQAKASVNLYSIWGVYPWQVVNPEQQPEKWSDSLTEKLLRLGRLTTLECARTELATTIPVDGVLSAKAVSSCIEKIAEDIDQETGTSLAPVNRRRRPSRGAVRAQSPTRGRRTASPNTTNTRGVRNTSARRRRSASMLTATQNQGGRDSDEDRDMEPEDAPKMKKCERGGACSQVQDSIEVQQNDDLHNMDDHNDAHDQEEPGSSQNHGDFCPPFDRLSMAAPTPRGRPAAPVSVDEIGPTPVMTRARNSSMKRVPDPVNGRGQTPSTIQSRGRGTGTHAANSPESERGRNCAGKRSRRQSLYEPRKRHKASLETDDDRTMSLMQPSFIAVNYLPLDDKEGSREDVLAHFLSVPAARCNALFTELTDLDRTRSLAEKALENANEELRKREEENDLLRDDISELEKEIAAKESHRTALLAAENEAVEATERLNLVRKAAGLPEVEETPMDSLASSQVGAEVDALRLRIAARKEELATHIHFREKLNCEIEYARQQSKDIKQELQEIRKEHLKWCELTNSTALQVSLLFNLRVAPRQAFWDENMDVVADGPTVLTAADQLEDIQTPSSRHHSQSQWANRSTSVDLGARD